MLKDTQYVKICTACVLQDKALILTGYSTISKWEVWNSTPRWLISVQDTWQITTLPGSPTHIVKKVPFNIFTGTNFLVQQIHRNGFQRKIRGLKTDNKMFVQIAKMSKCKYWTRFYCHPSYLQLQTAPRECSRKCNCMTLVNNRIFAVWKWWWRKKSVRTSFFKAVYKQPPLLWNNSLQDERRNCVVSLKVGSSCIPEYTFKFVQANISKCIPRKFTHSNNLHIKKLQTEFNGALHTHVGVRSEKNSIKTYLLLSQHFHGGNQAFTILRENRKINILICTFCLVHSLKVQYHPRLNTTSILCVTLVNHKLHLK